MTVLWRIRWVLLLLLLGSAGSASAAGITLGQLTGLDGNGQCRVRPSVGAAIYNAIIAARTTGGLSDAQVLTHAASRLGFGISPLGPLTPMTANDCTTVFVADELANQLAVLGTKADSAQLTQTRRGVTPLTMFPRADLNKSIWRQQQDPQGVALNSYSTMWYEARTQPSVLQTLRELVGSQSYQGGVIADVQLNLEQVMLEFWLNHFNVNTEKANQYYYGSNGYPEVVKAAQGGTFEALLTTVMREPGMLYYLDNKDNRCDPATGVASNQNLARELLELHTLGLPPTAGVYNQRDVEAMASALCGWNVIPYPTPLAAADSGFVFNSSLASTRSLTLLGKAYPTTGSGRVPVMLRALATHSATRTNVCGKLSARFFAAPLVAGARSTCVAAWGTQGNLKAMLTAMFKRADFWKTSNYRKLKRTPLELVVSAARAQGGNLLDLATATAAAGLTQAPFTPATITPQQVIDRTAALRAQRPFKFMNSLMWRIRLLIGVQRGAIASPAGYPMDGAAFLSSSYLEAASQMGLEVASTFGYLLDPDRNDLSSRVNRDAVTAKLATATPDVTQEWFFESKLRLGNVINGGSAAPFVFTPSHTSLLRTVFRNTAYWAYWSTSSTAKLSTQTLIGLALGTSQTLWR